MLPRAHSARTTSCAPSEDRALLNAECPHHRRIVVWLLRYTGVRVAEAHALTIADLDFTPEGEALTVRGSKTAAATRTIPLLPQLLPLIHDHLEFLRQRTSVTPDTPLLATTHGTPMTTNYLWRVVKRVACEAGVRPIACTCETTRQDRHARGCPRTSSGENRSSVSPHTLRRTFGSDLINRGLRLEAASKLLGHSSTTITERAYAQLLGPTIRRELFEAFQHDQDRLVLPDAAHAPGMSGHGRWDSRSPTGPSPCCRQEFGLCRRSAMRQTPRA